ncbi:MAG: SDR family NAD(P)-dependent oxidoreductase [Deltaproteobacteria bacterium]|jgi:uncharacterized protein|nr:SDR family NAD(P)-dependent oxidoreductase [Deltaproteobacteria bacterium]
MKSLENQTIVITGATSGLGLSLAIQAVQEKANVVLLSRSNNALEKVAAKLKLIASENTKIEYFAADLSNQKDLEKTFKYLENIENQVDIFINNAGFGLSGEFVQNDWNQVEKMCNLNMLAVARLSYWAGNYMKKRKSGSILNISAIAAIQAQPFFGIYGATRSFITNLSLAMYKELKSYNVHVSCAHPGSFKSGFENNARINDTLAVKMLGHMSVDVVAKRTFAGLKKRKAFFVIGFPYKMIYWSSLVTPKLIGLKIMGILFKQQNPV